MWRCSTPSSSCRTSWAPSTRQAPARRRARRTRGRPAGGRGRRALAAWDFTTPTGIEGYDAPTSTARPADGAESRKRRGDDLHPVARQAIRATSSASPSSGVRARVQRRAQGPAPPPRAHPHGRRVGFFDWVPQHGLAVGRGSARLRAAQGLPDALDAGDPDLRGRLRAVVEPERLPLGQAPPHRVRPLPPTRSASRAGGRFRASSLQLRGIARGGYDVSTRRRTTRGRTPVKVHVQGRARAPLRRRAGHGARARSTRETSLPGGMSGVLTSQFYANLLGRWLTNDTYPLRTEHGRRHAEPRTASRCSSRPTRARGRRCRPSRRRPPSLNSVRELHVRSRVRPGSERNGEHSPVSRAGRINSGRRWMGNRRVSPIIRRATCAAGGKPRAGPAGRDAPSRGPPTAARAARHLLPTSLCRPSGAVDRHEAVTDQAFAADGWAFWRSVAAIA